MVAMIGREWDENEFEGQKYQPAEMLNNSVSGLFDSTEEKNPEETDDFWAQTGCSRQVLISCIDECAEIDEEDHTQNDELEDDSDEGYLLTQST